LELLDYDWDDMFVAVKSGEIDLAIASITITTERSEEMLFSTPYFNGGQTLLIKSDNETIRTFDDLTGKKVGAQSDTTSLEEAIKHTKDETLAIPYSSYDTESSVTGNTIWSDIESGEIDSIILDLVAAVDATHNYPTLKIVGEPFTQEFYGMPTHKGNISLMNEINKALAEMKRDGELKNIENKWIK